MAVFNFVGSATKVFCPPTAAPKQGTIPNKTKMEGQYCLLSSLARFQVSQCKE